MSWEPGRSAGASGVVLPVQAAVRTSNATRIEAPI